MYDLSIIGGSIYLDHKWVKSNLYIDAGKIACISEEILPAVKIQEADGLKVIPGLIDPHVHLAMNAGKYISADDFLSGSIAAAYGGVTTVIDFLDERPTGEGIIQEFGRKSALAKESIIDYSFHAAICELKDSADEIARAALSIGSPTIKLYTTYKPASYSSARTINKMIERSSKNDIRILCHAEDDDLIDFELQDIHHLGQARPPEVEISQVIKIADAVRQYNGQAYIVHTSCGSTVQRLKEEYFDILNKRLFLESVPHYFYFDDSVYQRPDAYRFSMTPPLRPKVEQQRLREYYRLISVFATDHCPFMCAEKENKKISETPMGVGGIEHSFALMYELFGDEVIPRFTEYSARLHGMYPQKGCLAKGSDADITMFENLEHAQPFENHSRQDDSIYRDIQTKVKVEHVISRGNFVIKNGVLHPNQGHMIRRSLVRNVGLKG